MLVKKIILFIFIGVFLITSINAFSTNKFNLPRCYQETANVSSCGGLGIGTYGFDGSWDNVSALIDGNWNTAASITCGTPCIANFYANYSKKTNKANAIWQIRDGTNLGSGYFNLTIPDDCFNYNSDKLLLRIFNIEAFNFVTYFELNYTCYNGSEWKVLRNHQSGGFLYNYEEAIIWNNNTNLTNENFTFTTEPDLNLRYLNISKNIYFTHATINLTGLSNGTSYPSDLDVYFGDLTNNPYQYSILDFGDFNYNVNLNIRTMLNLFLPDCNDTGNFCNIPIGFVSGTGGIINYNNINVTNEGIVENSLNFSNSTYVSDTESFRLDVTYDYLNYQAQANFTYNGTTYSSTKSSTATGSLFTNSIPITSPIGNKSFYWTVYLTNSTGSVFAFNSTTNTQLVNNITFSLCNPSNNVTYLNFTFKDENTGNNLNASMDLATFYLGSGLNENIFSNTTLNPSYAFCFKPSFRSVQALLQFFQYSSTGYPQRAYYLNANLTNTSTNQVLYLLASGQGIYSTFSTTFNNQPVSGVTLQVERQFNGVWTLLTQGVTDSAGSTTFWLNPNYQHRITASKSGYSTQQVIVSPSQSLYTIQLNPSSNYTIASTQDGLSWGIFPSVGLLTNQSYNFGFNITSSKNNLVKCKFNLMNGTNVIDSSESVATPSFCSASVVLNPSIFGYKKLKGTLYIDIGNGYEILEGDPMWILEPTNSTGMTISDFFRDVSTLDLNYFGNDSTHREYTMIVLFFMFCMIVMAGLSMTGWDLTSNGGTLLILLIFTWIASIPGFLTLSGVSPFSFIDQYFIAICLSAFMGGHLFRMFT